LLLIIVTPEGDVQNRILHTDRPYTQTQLVEATNFFNRHYAGQPFGALRSLLTEELTSLREDIGRLMTAAVDAGTAAMDEANRCSSRGEEPAQRRRPRVEHGRLRRLFDLFEQKTSLLHLLDARRRRRGCSSTSVTNRDWSRSTSAAS